jgi:hypothetical protein
MSGKRMRFRRFVATLGGAVGGAGRAGASSPLPGKARGFAGGPPGGRSGHSRAEARLSDDGERTECRLLIVLATPNGEPALVNRATTGSREWRRLAEETPAQFLTRVRATAPRPAFVIAFPAREISP